MRILSPGASRALPCCLLHGSTGGRAPGSASRFEVGRDTLIEQEGTVGTVRTAAVIVAVGLACLLGAPAAGAAGPIRLVLDQGAAFSLLGHSCGGIQEQVYATGFGAGPGGYPEGVAYLSTRCGGSGRGGGYKVTEYKGAASVVWNWFGERRSFARLEGPAGGGPEFSAEDAHGDRIYNVGTAAYLETGEPPLQPPAAPSGSR